MVELIGLANSVIMTLLALSNDLTQIVNFPTRIPDCDSHSPAFLDLFISSGASICPTIAVPPLKNSDHIDHQTQKEMSLFIAQLMTIVLLIGTVIMII